MPRNQHVQSVVRAFDILEAVNSSPRALSLAEIADAVGLKTTTAHNLIRTLVHKGYLARETRPVRFRTGPAVAGMIHDFCRDSLLARADTELREFVERFPAASPLLCQYADGDALVRLRLQPQRSGVLERPIHETMHPYATATGVLIQAFLPQETRAAYRERHPFRQHGAHLWESEEAFDNLLCEVRNRGVSVPWENEPKGALLPVAAPVLRPNGELAAAFGASIPTADLDADAKQMFIEAVRDAADRLSNQY